ncbi:bud13 like protein [Quercus suber]|uniref:Bud13 like protein n=1 Tax=Quercus suber TaxID=58331 RepID=A0AAW0KKA5_QUESU
MDPSISGRGAEPTYRDKKGYVFLNNVYMLDWVSLLNAAGERISKEEFLKQRKKVKVEEKPKEIKLEWGKGLAQKREAEARLQELESEKDKPFARTRDDPELDKMLRERIRDGDPMAHLVKAKLEEEEVKPELGNSSSLGNGTWIGTETQASSSSIEVSENNFNRRLLSKGSVVNGFIVYTRVRKSRFNFPYESYEISDNDRNKRLKGSDELENNVIASVYSRRKDKEVQIVAGNGSNCNLGINICKDVQESELERFPAKGRGGEGAFLW